MPFHSQCKFCRRVFAHEKMNPEGRAPVCANCWEATAPRPCVACGKPGPAHGMCDACTEARLEVLAGRRDKGSLEFSYRVRLPRVPVSVVLAS
jgi:hypothetical protein